MTLDFLSEVMKAKRNGTFFQMLKEKNCQPGILYAVEISSRNEGETKTFSDGKAKKQKKPKRICCQHTYSRRMAKGNSLNGKKKDDKRKIPWNIRNEERTQEAKIWVNNRLPFSS